MLNCPILGKASVVNSAARISRLDVMLIVDWRRCSEVTRNPCVWCIGESLKTVVNRRALDAARHVDDVLARMLARSLIKRDTRLRKVQVVVVKSVDLGEVSDRSGKRATHKVKRVNKANANFQ